MDVISTSQQDIELFKKEHEKRKTSKLAQQRNKALWQSGELIRNHVANSGINAFQVQWTASSKLSGVESVAKDLEILPINWRVSVKENADVFINSSATTAFIDLPQGIFGQKARGGDWFLYTAANEFQNYYRLCIPLTVQELKLLN